MIEVSKCLMDRRVEITQLSGDKSTPDITKSNFPSLFISMAIPAMNGKDFFIIPGKDLLKCGALITGFCTVIIDIIYLRDMSATSLKINGTCLYTTINATHINNNIIIKIILLYFIQLYIIYYYNINIPQCLKKILL